MVAHFFGKDGLEWTILNWEMCTRRSLLPCKLIEKYIWFRRSLRLIALIYLRFESNCLDQALVLHELHYYGRRHGYTSMRSNSSCGNFCSLTVMQLQNYTSIIKGRILQITFSETHVFVSDGIIWPVGIQYLPVTTGIILPKTFFFIPRDKVG